MYRALSQENLDPEDACQCGPRVPKLEMEDLLKKDRASKESTWTDFVPYYAFMQQLLSTFDRPTVFLLGI